MVRIIALLLILYMISGAKIITEIAISGQFAYLADGRSGLKIIDISNPLLPKLRGQLKMEGFVKKVEIWKNLAVIKEANKLHIVNVGTPSSPEVVQEIQNSQNTAFTIAADILFLLKDNGLLSYYKLAEDGSIQLIGAIQDSIRFMYSDIYISDNLTFIKGGLEIHILDFKNAKNPELLSSIPIGAYNIARFQKRLLIYQNKSLKVFNIDNPRKPLEVSGSPFPLEQVKSFPSERITVNNNKLFIAGTGVNVVDITNPEAPLFKINIPTGTNSNGRYTHNLAIKDGFVFAALVPQGMEVINLSAHLPAATWGIQYQPFQIKIRFNNSQNKLSVTLPLGFSSFKELQLRDIRGTRVKGIWYSTKENGFWTSHFQFQGNPNGASYLFLGEAPAFAIPKF